MHPRRSRATSKVRGYYDYVFERVVILATLLRIDPKLWKKAKMKAIERDMNLYELVENALKKEIGEE